MKTEEVLENHIPIMQLVNVLIGSAHDRAYLKDSATKHLNILNLFAPERHIWKLKNLELNDYT